MQFLITGGTGFIGRALVERLIREGHQVTVLTRRLEACRRLFGAEVRCLAWDGQTPSGWATEAEGCEVVVNLAGENIASGRWTARRKEQFRLSRVQAGQALMAAIQDWQHKPTVFFQASAVGYYGHRGEEILDETSAPGSGFLPELVQDWEQSTLGVEALGIRRVVMRIGIVLGKDGGMMARMLPPFRFFLGGPLGSGRQWLSWIHLTDLIEALLFLLGQHGAKGVFNFTAPEPVRMKQFCRTLGSLLHRPSFLHVPAPLLRLAFGDMAREALLVSQRVVPARLVQAGYPFRYPQLRMALAEVLDRQQPGA
ncbi:MAG: TIGR01777 family protein [Calditrichaeota bacterium]|nr:MAG: TIGR01777 family protein [Calditrichota bacterium]